jgi:hypothetical protein
VLVNYAVANGIAGIAFSMANAFPAWHAVVMFIFYSQAISVGQGVGIILSLIGSIILTADQQIKDCFVKQKSDSSVHNSLLSDNPYNVYSDEKDYDTSINPEKPKNFNNLNHGNQTAEAAY